MATSVVKILAPQRKTARRKLALIGASILIKSHAGARINFSVITNAPKERSYTLCMTVSAKTPKNCKS